MYFVTELQARPDGIINATITARSSLALGLALYYQRAAVAVTSELYTGIALTLQSSDGQIVLNEHFDTLYQPTENE